MKNAIRSLSILLALVMLFGTFTACKDKENEETTPAVTEPVQLLLTGEHAELIMRANSLKNGVTPYYSDSDREKVMIDNKTMSLAYRIDSSAGDMLLTNFSTPSGKNYIENTMDVFLQLENGKKFYTSASPNSASLNIYRNGYYYYENRIEGQTFSGDNTSEEAYSVNIQKGYSTNDIKTIGYADKAMNFSIINARDPWVSYGLGNLKAKDYGYLEITVRTDKKSIEASQIFLISGSLNDYSEAQSIRFNLKTDGEYHTYRFALSDFKGYGGTLRAIRLDINAAANSSVSIKDIKLIKSNSEIPDSLAMQRSFLTYSDKLHQIVQLSTAKSVSNVAYVGIITNIEESTIEKLIVKDKNGLQSTLDKVDWASAEYVGFDIKDVGVFGYILPCDDGSGSIEVTLKEGVYTVVQKKVPKGGKLIPSTEGTQNKNDFFMGNRIYNDESHSFDAFINEAECERNPLTKENITVESADKTDLAYFMGYQALYGYYKFHVNGTDFNTAYYNTPNRHFRVKFSISGDSKDRNIYVSTYTSSGNLESAVLLDENDMLLPVPIEVSKNFASDGENTIFNLDDAAYGETYLPLTVKANGNVTYSILNLYQNWGAYPLKQISSIQYFSPYYHLSTGVTETNCISPLVQSGPALPDFRAMSAPLWKTQPQHTQGGDHSFFAYTDANGNYTVSENTSADIDSYGLTYCDITLGYTSADGKISATYVHTEMPQLDENRTYYETKFTFNEDVSFSDFADDFFFYRVGPNNVTGTYKQVGYLDENNESQVVKAVDGSGTKFYVLGDKCPYFSFFDMPDYTDNKTNIFGYVNVSCLVYNYEVIINGKKTDASLIIKNSGKYVSLSLDLEDVTFKKGDSITLNMILMPWGSEKLDYTVAAPDINVREVRENSLLNALKLTAGTGCEVLDSVFVPKARTTDGNSAEFTVSGGNDNSAVRIYGFDKLTVPKIEEFVDGKWVEYNVNSASNPDKNGIGHNYDGYMVYYDGDGTFSYSFVIDMDDGAPRTFRISADSDFSGWGE